MGVYRSYNGVTALLRASGWMAHKVGGINNTIHLVTSTIGASSKIIRVTRKQSLTPIIYLYTKHTAAYKLDNNVGRFQSPRGVNQPDNRP
jgi:hypothetical protein